MVALIGDYFTWLITDFVDRLMRWRLLLDVMMINDFSGLIEKAKKTVARFEELGCLVSAPEVVADERLWRSLVSEYEELCDVVEISRQFLKCQSNDCVKEQTNGVDDLTSRLIEMFNSFENKPESEPEEKIIPKVTKKNIKTDFFRASGAGGQHVNKTESAVRLTHLPTGITAVCQDQRSQLQNRQRAFETLCKKVEEYYKSQNANGKK